MKLSSRKQLLKESELTLKSIKKSLNEGPYDYAVGREINRDIDILVGKFETKKKEFDEKIKRLMDSIFTSKVATEIASKHLTGRKLKDLEPFLRRVPPGLDEIPIKKVKSASFYTRGSSEKSKSNLGLQLDLEFENGETYTYKWNL